MKTANVLRYVGLMIALMGVAMLTCVPVAWWYDEMAALPGIGAACLLSLALGLALFLPFRRVRSSISRRDAFAIVTFTWLSISLFGALPYVLTGVLPNLADAYFETMSGFTTTGASVMPTPEDAPRSILYWRALTQWLGGMGVVVLFVAVFSELGVGGRFLFNSEVPGPITESLRPRIRDVSSFLWKLYLGLTITLIGALMLAGLGAFDAVCHALTTLSTGGFSTRNISVGAFDNTAVNLIVTVFMILAGLSFSLYHQALLGHPRVFLRDHELRWYLGILFAATLVIAVDSAGFFESGWTALEHAFFHVASVMTTTGFAVDDFDRYPALSKILLVTLMFVGGSAGSTAGGLKVIRLIILIKQGHRGLYRLIRSHVVMPVRIGRQVIPEEAVAETTGFFFLYMAIFVLGTLYVAAHGMDMATSMSSVAATLGNIGPGISVVGPYGHYGSLPADVKVVLSLFMCLGRLELYTVLSLALPVFWRR